MITMLLNQFSRPAKFTLRAIKIELTSAWQCKQFNDVMDWWQQSPLPDDQDLLSLPILPLQTKLFRHPIRDDHILCITRQQDSVYMTTLLNGYSFPDFSSSITPIQVVWRNGKTREQESNEETRWKRQCYLYFFSSNVIFVLLKKEYRSYINHTIIK